MQIAKSQSHTPLLTFSTSPDISPMPGYVPPTSLPELASFHHLCLGCCRPRMISRTESMPAQCHPGAVRYPGTNSHSEAAAAKACLVRDQSRQLSTAKTSQLLGGT